MESQEFLRVLKKMTADIEANWGDDDFGICFIHGFIEHYLYEQDEADIKKEYAPYFADPGSDE